MHQFAGLGIKKAVKYVFDQADAGLLPENLIRLIELANARSNVDSLISFQILYGWLGLKNARKSLKAGVTLHKFFLLFLIMIRFFCFSFDVDDS